jgi:hypothetical protein
MKTTLKKISLITLLTITSTWSCSEVEAFNKMMAINRVQQAMTLETQNDDKEKTLTKMLHSLNDDMQSVNSNYMMKNDYTGACSAYDNIIQKYNIDLQKASKGMLTIEQLQKDGGKDDKSCSLSEASIKMTTIIEKMQKLVENADMAMGEFEEFNRKHEKIIPLMTTNPSKYCNELDKITKEYIKE